MRLKVKPEGQHKLGDMRLKRGFVIAKKIKNEWRFFERTSWWQAYTQRRIWIESGNIKTRQYKHYWIDVAWGDRYQPDD